MTAITPSLNAVSRSFSIPPPSGHRWRERRPAMRIAFRPAMP
jgi:hypothetical protein